jgi:tetratricopeptide (TPR) repeat protein
MAPNGTWKGSSDGKSPEEIITGINPQIMKLVQSSNQGEANIQTHLYFRRLLVELHYAIDSPDKDKVTKELYDEYDKLGDKAGMANCKIIEADRLLSPPFSSPVIQNLIPVHAPTATGDCNLWDPVEKTIPLEQSDEADECYERSLEYFRESNCGRGQAAVLLRQGSILHAKACSLSTSNPGRVKLLEDATKKYDEALKFFGRDEANSQILKTNQILLDISKGSHSSKDLKQRASGIGKWGLEHKNEVLSFHLTVFMLRFARREWERYNNFDVAQVCYECAYSCATELGALTPAFVSMCSRAEIHYETNNSTTALVMADHCINMLDSILHYYDDLINATTDTPMGKMDKQHFVMKKFEFLWSVGHTVGGIYARTDDLDRFKSWEKKYLACFEEDENCVSQAKQYLLNDIDVSSWVKQTWGTTID